jgi:N6-L-threonylcarbamoyladenine synthase
MRILAIETSCDDTGIAILEIEGKNPPAGGARFKILSNLISSQVKLHAKYGGVYPTLAKREHKKNLPLVLKRALKEAHSASGRTKIDYLAITSGPGLEPCLWTGINFAEELAKKMKLPLLPVNHIEAHILANMLDDGSRTSLKFPAVCLVVSGGHTQLILIKKIGSYKILGETRDDAAGECFDKAARILGLGYPGGPAISRLAHDFQSPTLKSELDSAGSVILPRPMIKQDNYDFSFSGLKTAILYHHQKQSPKTQKSASYIKSLCKEIQQAIIDVLLYKTAKAARDYGAKTIILGGGVTANDELRKQFQQI